MHAIENKYAQYHKFESEEQKRIAAKLAAKEALRRKTMEEAAAAAAAAAAARFENSPIRQRFVSWLPILRNEEEEAVEALQ